MQLVLDAINVFEKATCLKFVQRTTETQYIQIFTVPKQCYSIVGKQPPRNNKAGQVVALSISNDKSQFDIYNSTAFGEPYDFESSDGNLVLYSVSGNGQLTALWSTASYNMYNPPVRLIIRLSGDVVLVKDWGKTV
ncbi:hypothetical protein BV898_08515 [Hypsibius exemplaris]|uniref:Peptidase M12A domain-containing protein n=1 Tax=Hypsibius exemplaris TaxID=2072580 RepID=A0A1W0WQE3_HYPEX|nr:hypothetical protein BV898_08515 [Hypsibius exemplaris]